MQSWREEIYMKHYFCLINLPRNSIFFAADFTHKIAENAKACRGICIFLPRKTEVPTYHYIW